jgi:hypothetical protein
MTRYSSPQDGISTTEICSQLYVFLRWVVCGDNLACMVIKGFSKFYVCCFQAKLGSGSSGLVLILKSWWQPSVTLSLAAVRDHFQGKTKLGFGLRVENFGGVRCDFLFLPFFLGECFIGSDDRLCVSWRDVYQDCLV